MKKRKKGNTNKKAKVNRKKKGIKISFKFPAQLIAPVGFFLKKNLELLKKRKKQIDKADPFKDAGRVIDNASPDTDAEEQFGHARASALKEQIDKKIIQTKKALARIKMGKYGICEDCGNMIDTDRLMVYPEATLCASCKKDREK